MKGKTATLVGVLLFLFLVIQAQALDTPREIVLEVNRIVDLAPMADTAPTGIPDLDTFLSRYPGTITSYAVQAPPGRHRFVKRYLLLRLHPGYEHQTGRIISVTWVTGNGRITGPPWKIPMLWFSLSWRTAGGRDLRSFPG